jgi:cell filamentation protein
VSGEERLTAEEAARQARESDLVSFRLLELRDNPIQGNFDAEHLKAVHGYIFQDLPHHQPGIVREDTKDWIKHRALEGRPAVYNVHYASQGIEAKITNALDQFGGPEAITGLTPDAAAARLTELYGDLDHAHGFYEGNSRTLREFTLELAEEAGFTIDWTRTGVGPKERNELYVARDLAVYEREFPGLTEEKAMQTDDRREYEAYYAMSGLRNAVGDRSLDAIIRRASRMHSMGASEGRRRQRHARAPFRLAARFCHGRPRDPLAPGV